ncbi:MAG: carboxypeptidase M32 [Rhodospirillales bacterium]|nr:MAG: carboxypeptidase M32 [Rhodospirillales bacterium]
MTPGFEAYARLEEAFRRHALIEETIGVLHWDMAVMMPPGGARARAEQIADLRVLAHDMLTHERLAEDLAAAESDATGLDSWQAANLREMWRIWHHANALPSDLVAARSRATSECETVWRTARPRSDFRALRPSLEEVVRLTREAGVAKSEAFGRPLYDALMDEYEPDADARRVIVMLEDYAAFLPAFLDEVLATQARRCVPAEPPGPFSVADQKRLCRLMAETVGLDFDSARMDESLHPFSTGIADDSRITTRYNKADYSEALMGVLHESGHAMYERGLPRDWHRQPVGDARGMTLHESQSLLIEMQICRSRRFFEWAAPVIAKAFRASGPAWTPDNLYRLATRVRPGFIRVDADEVTYPAHIVLRTRLEMALMAGDLVVADLPGAWRDGLTELLDITPPDDRLGCMQDVHWPDGNFGYFPTYTLGAMAAAQLAAAARTAEPGIMSAIGRGDFTPLMRWLRSHVHGKGSLLSTDELLCEATGSPLDAAVFKAHLRDRYLEAA